MSLFISYARSDEGRAELVAEQLRAGGYEVWRDDQLPAHRAYAEVIEERLQDSKAVVVLWSAEAAVSQWVRAEADLARNAGKLIQATLDGKVAPIPFNQIQCADLAGWNGERDNSGWRKLAASVAALAGEESTPSVAESSTQASRQTSICVLPFANMSGDAEQEYFSDGISEDITTDLSKVSALAVTARNTAFTFKGRSVNVREIAGKLGVTHVLEGSVRKAGGRVRITAQLIDGASGDHVWAERYDRDLTDIFAIQDEISEAIVEALKVKLLPKEKRAIEQRGTANADAYDLYLMARKFWISGNYGDERRDRIVARTAERATELDPGYARAWALIAIARASLRYHHGLTGDDGLKEAERALALDPTIAEAHAVRARNFAEQGDLAGAEREILRGLALDPRSWDVVREAARLMMMQRRVDEAKQYFVRATELDESDFHSAMMLITCYQAAGDAEGMRAAAQMGMERADRAIAQDPLNGAALGTSAGALAYLGRVAEAKERYHRATIVDPDNLNMPYNFACVLAWLGEKDAAINLIEAVIDRISPALLITALADPDMDPLRDDPRFQRLIARAMEITGVTPDMVPKPPAPTAN